MTKTTVAPTGRTYITASDLRVGDLVHGDEGNLVVDEVRTTYGRGYPAGWLTIFMHREGISWWKVTHCMGPDYTVAVQDAAPGYEDLYAGDDEIAYGAEMDARAEAS